ncbi:MAG: class I SAM-dependent methyltransferase, partial [Candidatus Hodarchaeales archaeon]
YTTYIQSQFTDRKLGSREYFQEIKIHHDKAYALCNQILNLPSLNGKSVLEIGCGIGLDALAYAKHGAHVTAIDLSHVCIDLANRYFADNKMRGVIEIGNAERLTYDSNSFDVVVARQVLMFTPNTQKAVDEMYRVLKPGGTAVVLLHNKYSWYALLGKITGTNLIAETKDPPVNNLHSTKEVKKIFQKFSQMNIFFDRFPYKTNRRTGTFIKLYNYIIVPFSKILPKAIMQTFGWYIIIKAIKEESL